MKAKAERKAKKKLNGHSLNGKSLNGKHLNGNGGARLPAGEIRPAGETAGLCALAGPVGLGLVRAQLS